MNDLNQKNFTATLQKEPVKLYSLLTSTKYLKRKSFVSKHGIACLLFFSIFITSISVSKAQVVKEWDKLYNGPGNGGDQPTALAVDGSGNVYVAGFSDEDSSNLSNLNDYSTVKYDANGVQQWAQTYNGTGNGNDALLGMAVDGSGNVYVTGWANNGLNNDFATIKYNAAGVQQWVQIYNGPANGHDQANAIAVDGSGNVYVTGESTQGTNSDYTTIKYDASGVQQWIQTFNGAANQFDRAGPMAIDGAGNVYITGLSFNGANTDIVTIKYNGAGVQQWFQVYNGTANGNDNPYDLEVDAAGNVYIAGRAFNGANNDYVTIKYNSSGTQQWAQLYNGVANDIDQAQALGVDASGNVYVTGLANGITSMGGSNSDFATIKYNSAGVQEWVKLYDGAGTAPESDFATALALDGSGYIYVTGRADTGPNSDYATIKYDAAGVEQWVELYNGPGNGSEQPSAIVVNSCGNIYVTGFGFSGTSPDFATVKYVPVSSVPTITVVPGPGPSIGGDPNTIYLGYGPQFVTLQASSGTGFSWSPTAGLSDPSISNPVFTPTAAGTYTFTVTVTNNNGCEASASVIITVINARCGNSNNKVLICHNGHEICVSPTDVSVHLNHAGDYLGGCASNNARHAVMPTVNGGTVMKAYPNPFSTATNLNFTLEREGSYKIELLDIKGSLVRVIDEGEGVAGKNYSYEINSNKLQAGIYIVRLVAADKVKHLRVVLNR